MKAYGGVWGGKGNNWLDFRGDQDPYVDCKIENPAIA